MFELIEAHKATLDVQEYSVSQTTLEQIFNEFASTQEEETGGARGITGDNAGAPELGRSSGPVPAFENTKTTRVMVTVPQGVTPGQQVAFTAPNGRQHNATVPAGAAAGSNFAVEVPC